MKRISQIILTLTLLSVPFFTSCDKMIYENLEECPQGVYISFYHQTPCMQEAMPVGEVNGLDVFAFDLNDVLVKVEHIEGLVDLIKAYKVELPPVEKGQYYFIAWAGGTKNLFEVNNFEIGKTTRKDVMMTLRSEKGQALSLTDHKVWQGESRVISLPERDKFGSVFDEVAINMLEVTNRINLTFKLHESVCDKLNIEDFDISISSANGTYLMDKTMPLGTPTLQYLGVQKSKEETLENRFYTLMDLKSGYNNSLKIYNRKEDKVYFNHDLLGKVLLENPNVNLECTKDFDIVVEIEDKCASCPDNNLVVTIIINNYKLHSFAVDLSNRY